jgi:Polyketide cyclase / dehydrase and lipid transport
MAIVQRNVQIKASPQEAMALLSDASRWPDWYPGMTEIDIAAPFPDEGGKVAFKVKSAGMSMSITETFSSTSRASCSFFKWRACCRGELAGSSPRNAMKHG